MKKILSIFILSLVLISPFTVAALEMPTSGNMLATMNGIGANSYVVLDVKTGQVLISNNEDSLWTPASLTKLVTALVVLDSKTKLTKVVSMTKDDQVAGGCSVGGACIKSATGVTFTVDGLFHAALMPSANNAANALSRSTGLTKQQFVDKMNAKAKELGATNTNFKEPTGMDPENKTTAGDFAKIVAAAFSNSYLRTAAAKTSYVLKSSNNSKYTQTIKNTNKLLSDPDITVLGAKTGYLNESGYNFASLIKIYGDLEVAVVVLGEKRLADAFAETKQLANLSVAAKFLNFGTSVSQPAVLGLSVK